MNDSDIDVTADRASVESDDAETNAELLRDDYESDAVITRTEDYESDAELLHDSDRQEEDGGEDDAVAASSQSSFSDKIDYRQLLPLVGLQMCERFTSDSIYSFVAFLVLDFSAGLTQDEVGRYAGFVAGARFLGSALSA